MMNTWTSRCLVGVLGCLFSSLAPAGEKSYTFYDIFFPGCSPPSGAITEAADINDHGVVVGYYTLDNCLTAHGFTWLNGVMTDLDPTYDAGTFRGAESIARIGTVLGIGSPDIGLVLENESVQVLPLPTDCVEASFANNINDAGTMVVGQCSDGGSVFWPVAFWLEDGTGERLDMLPGLPEDADGDARDVNDAGVVVVQIEGESRSYTWMDDEITEVPNLLGGKGATVTAINNHNLIVGEAEVGIIGCMAMSYDLNTGVMTALGLGRADGVNDRGAAVGRDILDGSVVHAILYQDGEAIDLSAFFPPSLADDAKAVGINNYGWIVGSAEEWGNGPEHGWLLVPLYDKGDYDGDGDVDLQDSGHFQRCFAAEPYQGPEGGLHVGCIVFDFDDDVDLDLADYAAFQSAFTGPTAPNRNPNGPG